MYALEKYYTWMQQTGLRVSLSTHNLIALRCFRCHILKSLWDCRAIAMYLLQKFSIHARPFQAEVNYNMSGGLRVAGCPPLTFAVSSMLNTSTQRVYSNRAEQEFQQANLHLNLVPSHQEFHLHSQPGSQR